MTRVSPRRSYRRQIAGGAVAIAMLMAGCDSSRETGPNEPNSKVDAGTTAATSGPAAISEPAVTSEPSLHLKGDTVTHNWVEVAIYADGRVLWAIGDGDPGYLQMRLTPEAVERLRSRAMATGLFEQDRGLILDQRRGSMKTRQGSIELRRDGRSVIVVWGADAPGTRRWAHAFASRDLRRASSATTEQEIDVKKLVALFRDPTAWTLPSSWYVQRRISPFVPARIVVLYDAGKPDWSRLPSPAREIASKRLGGLTRDGCQVISTDHARKIARALTQANINADYDSQRGLLVIRSARSFVHSKPALPHEVAC